MRGIINTAVIPVIFFIIIMGCSSSNEFDSFDVPQIQTELLYEIKDSEEILFQ